MLRLWSGFSNLAVPALRVALARRARRGKELPARLAERRGIASRPRPAGKLLWLHAASVGEAVSLLPLLRALPPSLHVLFTTGTVTSAHLLAERLPALGLEARVIHQFAPVDVAAWVRRFLAHWRPDAVAFVESELWPHMIAQAASRGKPLMLLNGRMSERSLRGWLRAPWLARRLIGAFDRIFAQSEADAARFLRLGGRQVEAAGNLKFCADPLPADEGAVADLRQALAERAVWLAASTHRGEEEIIARVHRRLLGEFPDLLTIIVPRHPGRGSEIAAALAAPQRSRHPAPPAGGLWIADSMGELGLFYRAVGVVFMGKSLGAEAGSRAYGGQNPLEPARLGCAVAIGPEHGNFDEAVALLRKAGGLAPVSGEAGLAAWVGAMLREPALAAAMGAAARNALDQEQALTARLAALLERAC